MRHVLLLSLSALTIFLSSCATVFTGVRQSVLIESNPPGAEIYVDNRKQGITPSRVTIHKDFDMVSDGGKDLRLVMEGYQENYFMEAKFNPVSIFN